MLRATAACNFSSLIWPAGSAPAALASLLFDPPEPQIIGKTQWIATLHLLSSHSFSSLLFSLLGFSSLTLPTSAFPSVHIVGSLTSKLPSINTSITWCILQILIFQHYHKCSVSTISWNLNICIHTYNPNSEHAEKRRHCVRVCRNFNIKLSNAISSSKYGSRYPVTIVDSAFEWQLPKCPVVFVGEYSMVTI